MRLSALLFFAVLTTFASCFGQEENVNMGTTLPLTPFLTFDRVSAPGKDIDCIFQDRNNNYWFASNGGGAYRYDGRTMLHITTKDGLCSDFVWSIQEDMNGNLWFATRDGICSFDGTRFANYTDVIKNAKPGALTYKKGGLFFSHTNGMCFYDGRSFTNFIITPAGYTPPGNSTYRPYGVYCTLVDRSGKAWFGTQEKGVCVYDGRSFSFIDGKDLGGPAVRSIYQDKTGVIWFGNNGGGLYRYDGRKLDNITEERHLSNYEFLREKKSVDKAGSLARVFAINEDRNGNLWIGTADAGVWKYDGTRLVNYTMNDGLSGNSVCVIYKDRTGDLWFVSNGDMVSRFDGHKFSRVNF